MSDTNDKLDRAEHISAKLNDALRHKNFSALLDIYTDDAVIWHNHDEIVMTKHDLGTALIAMWESGYGLGFTDIRISTTEAGFVQQCNIEGYKPSGETFREPCCIVVTLLGDRISSIYEYVYPRFFN